MLARSRLAAHVGLVLLPLAFAQLIRADCYTLEYGGVNGDPSDHGAYGTWYSTTYRLNGNEVYSYSTTGVYGPNAGLLITWVATYLYLNGNLINSYVANQNMYGATVKADTWWYLHDSSGYWLGTYQLGNPNGYRNDHWATSPYCQALGYPDIPIHHYDWGNTYTAVKPTITGVRSFWFLGGGPSIDGYYVQTTLTGNANWGSSPPLYWTVTQNPQKISLNATVANQVLVTSLAPSAPQAYDVTIQGSTDGLPTDPFTLNINAPARACDAVILKSGGGCRFPSLFTSVPAGCTGYQTPIDYSFQDMFGYTMPKITSNETFSNWGTGSSPPTAEWPNPTQAVWNPIDPQEWVDNVTLRDTMWAYDACNGTWRPVPKAPGGGNSLVKYATQRIFVGSGTHGSGQQVQSATMQWYVDHGSLVP